MIQSWRAKSVTTVLCPVPTKRLPFCASSGVPPTRVDRIETPSRSRNGPSGLRDRATNTPYPVREPLQQFVADPRKYHQPSCCIRYAPSYRLSIAIGLSVVGCERRPSAVSFRTLIPPK
nr:hypothetical protein [Frondihabitans sucicola]